MRFDFDILKWKIGVPDTLIIAQTQAFRHRVPILYALLSINVLMLAANWFRTAPRLLSVYIPAVLIVTMLAQAVLWYVWLRRPATLARARISTKLTTVLAGTLSLLLAGWAIVLYIVGKHAPRTSTHLSEYGQTVLFVGLTVVCTISLLMPARFVAILITLLIIPPFSVILAWNGTAAEVAAAVNLLLAGLAMLYVVMASARDFRQAAESRAELARMHAYQMELANTDSLTGLDNRRRFYAVLAELVDSGRAFAVMIVDLDAFKQVNDVHGHVAGDLVLREVSSRIAAASEGSVCTSRVGGDEFALLIAGEQLEDALLSRAHAIIDACNQPVWHNGTAIMVGACVGINKVVSDAFVEPHSKHIERADYALFHAKQQGRNRAEFFTPEHERKIKRAGLVEQTLKGADFEQELTLLFQPIVLAQTNALQGFEALVRWNSPLLGMVQPGEFIPIAERSELIFEVTRTVLRKAVEQAHQWPEDIQLKVNLSARDLASAQQMLTLLTILRVAAIDTRRLTFELTETAFSENQDAICNATTMIKATGASIAIDDFGTGYSSLATIHRLDPDLIKIDRSFTMRIGENQCSKAMIKTIIEMCRSLGARSLAEGVEDPAQVKILTELGCDELQGYWFSKPVNADAARQIAWKGRTSKLLELEPSA